MANIAPYTVFRAVRAGRIENKSIRSVEKDFGMPFLSPTTSCSRAFGDKRNATEPDLQY
jgi:hypothetical protein